MNTTLKKRAVLLDWLHHHTGSSVTSPDRNLALVEREVQHHARALAWDHAISIARTRGDTWSRRSPGMLCAEDWAARNFCRDFASELRALEPIPDEGSAETFVSKTHLAAFSPESRWRVLSWIHDVADEAEHDAWREVIRFTKNRAEVWIQEGEIATENDWELTTHTYAEAAAHACQLLEWDYTVHFIVDSTEEKASLPCA